MGALALFIVLAGGTAWATSELTRNSVKSKHIANGQVRSADVKNGNLTGRDIEEDTLGRVPSAVNAKQLGGINATVYAHKGSEEWKALDLLNLTHLCHYANYEPGYSQFNPASYFRDPSGVVHLRGAVSAIDGSEFDCESQTTLHMLESPIPAGYRPENIEQFTISANQKPGLIRMLPSGVLVLAGSGYPEWSDAEEWISLDGISYRCAPSGIDGCP